VFYKLRYFDSFGQNYPPGSLPMARGAYFGNVIQNKKKFVIANVSDVRLTSLYSGGVIVLPTDFSKTITDIAKMSLFIQTKTEELINCGCKGGFFSESFSELVNLIGLTEFVKKSTFVGCLFRGKYISDQKTVFDDASIAVELRGVPLKVLFLLTTLICNEFHQEEVIFKCFYDENIYMVTPSDFPIQTISNLLKYGELEIGYLDYCAPFFWV